MRKKLATVFFSLLLIIVGFIPMQNHEAFAFWTGRNPQHKFITELVVWPPNHVLFNEHSPQMALWSEEPDDGKDFLFGHGDEEKRAMCSFKAAVRHYENYLKDRTKSKELLVAAQCLGHAYHYFEDIGDFTEGNKDKRVRLGNMLAYIRESRNSNRGFYSLFRDKVDKKKLDIQNPRDLENIVQSLKKLKREGRQISVTESYFNTPLNIPLFWVIACLELVNERFLAREVSPYLLDKCPH